MYILILFNSGANSEHKDTNAEGTAEYDGINYEGAINTCKSSSSNWANSDLSLEEQLKVLNNQKEDDVQWEVQGFLVVPKSIFAAKLSKMRFDQGLTLTQAKSFVTSAAFKIDFDLYTTNFAVAPTSGIRPVS